MSTERLLPTLVLALAMAGSSSLALAQGAPAEPAQPPPPTSAESPEAPAPGAAPGPASAPAPVPPSQPPAGPDLSAVYEQAFAALTHGRFDTAIRGFDSVAMQSANPEQRAAARELARLARRYKDSQIHFSKSAAPSLTTTPALTAKARSEDDAPNAGRSEFVVSTTLAAFYAGIAVDVILDIDDFRAATFVVTAATAGGFLGSLFGSKDKRITGGMASAYSLGVGLGLSNGLLMSSPLGFDDADLFVSSGLVGMIIGGGGALLLADNVQPTRGQVSLASTLSMLGIATTGLGMVITEPDLSFDSALTLLTLGLDGGLAAGLALSPGLDWSTSRANLITLGSFLGAVGGFGTMALLSGSPDNETEGKLFATSTLIGMWAGFGLGIHFTKDMAPDRRFDQQPITVMPSLIQDAPGLAIMGSL